MLERIGRTYHALGHDDLARTALRHALERYRTQHPAADADRLRHRLGSLDRGD